MIDKKETDIENLHTQKEFKVLQAAKWYWPEVGGIETVAVAIIF